MVTFTLRRTLSMIPVIFLITIIAFGIVQVLPGDVALAVLGEEFARDEQAYEAARERFGLDDPLVVRYADWIIGAMQGDLGTSYRTSEPVTQALLRRLLPTAQLVAMSLVVALVVGLPMGILAATRPNTLFDAIGTFAALFGVAIPNFWFGILMVYVFSIWLNWLPPSGFVPIFEAPLASVRAMLMPSIALGTALAAVVVRQTRSALLEVLGEDFVRTARSKGVRGWVVVTKHALRNALIPVVTVIGMQVGRLFGGTMTVEIVFSIPGMGRLAVDSIFFRDFQVLQGIMLVTALAVMLASLLTDILYAVLDPRIQYG